MADEGTYDIIARNREGEAVSHVGVQTEHEEPKFAQEASQLEVLRVPTPQHFLQQ